MEGTLTAALDGQRFAFAPLDPDILPVELNCGDVIQLFIGGVWMAVRIEMNDNGYYVTTGEESFRPFFGMRAYLG